MIAENKFGGKKDVKRVVRKSMKEGVLQGELNVNYLSINPEGL